MDAVYNVTYFTYGKFPKISYTKVSDKMTCANSADSDQTAPEVWSGSALFAIPLSSLRKNYVKSKNLAKKVQNKVVKILGYLLYAIYNMWCKMPPRTTF